MLDRVQVFDTNPYRNLQHLRLEAMQALERCIAETEVQIMESFLEAQLILEPPPIELLREIAEDVQGRLYYLKNKSDLSDLEPERADAVMQMVEHIYVYITDWLHGLNALAARRAMGMRWSEIPPRDSETRLH
jgi:hypothetical protein